MAPLMDSGPPAAVRRDKPRTPGGSHGFTLVEVLVAVVILAFSFGALMQLLGTGLRGLNAAQDHVRASLLAENWLAGLAVDQPLAEGQQSGTFDDRFHWRATLRPPAIDERGDLSGWPVRAYEVELVVLWDEGDRQQNLSVTAVRLTPNP